MKTVQVKPWGKDQGDFVEINEDDFNPEVHELLGDKKLAAKDKKAVEAKAETAQ